MALSATTLAGWRAGIGTVVGRSGIRKLDGALGYHLLWTPGLDPGQW
jgi:hypothetical protein